MTVMVDKPKSRYPSWDVMTQREEWDPHTRDIVEGRLHPPYPGILPESSVKVLEALAAFFTGDDRREPIAFILGHIAQKVGEPWKEPQRGVDRPPLDQFIAEGLRYAVALSDQAFGKEPAALTPDETRELVERWGSGSHAESLSILRTMMVEGYASHPLVWSEMGYAGPAYPRGYVRMELGLTEPWEAHTDA